MAVAHRYVRTSGDNNADGTTETTAWRTLDYAASQDYSGNADGTDIHLAPGTYRETVVVDYAGASGRVTRFLGDPQCLWFVSEKPGRVRITGADSNEVPQNVTVVTSNQDYVEWHHVHLDGGTRGLQFSATGNGRLASDLIVSAGINGITYGSLLQRCIGVGGNAGFNAPAAAMNCIGLGGDYGFYTGMACNCLGLSGQYAFRQCACYNDIAIWAYMGFYGCTGDHCLAAWCVYDANTGDTAPTSSYAFQVYTALRLFSAGKQACLNLEALFDLVPWLAVNTLGGLLRRGSNTTPGFGASDVDAGGHRLRLKGSALDIGPWSVAENPDYPGGLLDFATYRTSAPSLRIVNEGDYALRVPARANQALQVSVWVRHDSLTGSQPQIVLQGDGLSDQTATCTANDGIWQQLTVSATPTKSIPLTPVLRARNSAGTCWFSDPLVTGADGRFHALPLGGIGPTLSAGGGLAFPLGL